MSCVGRRGDICVEGWVKGGSKGSQIVSTLTHASGEHIQLVVVWGTESVTNTQRGIVKTNIYTCQNTTSSRNIKKSNLL